MRGEDGSQLVSRGAGAKSGRLRTLSLPNVGVGGVGVNSRREKRGERRKTHSGDEDEERLVDELSLGKERKAFREKKKKKKKKKGMR